MRVQNSVGPRSGASARRRQQLKDICLRGTPAVIRSLSKKVGRLCRKIDPNFGLAIAHPEAKAFVNIQNGLFSFGPGWSKPREGKFVEGRDYTLVTVQLTEAQRLQLAKPVHSITYPQFLGVATYKQLMTLRGTVPLYWTTPADRPPRLVSLSGKKADGTSHLMCYAWMLKARSELSFELERRKIDDPEGSSLKPVHTGSLVWESTEYDEAKRAGRFVTIQLTEMQDLQIIKYPRLTLKEFLPRATHAQLTALKGATPLYWISYTRGEEGRSSDGSERPTELRALRGRGPGGVDYAWMKRGRSRIAAELKRRGIKRGEDAKGARGGYDILTICPARNPPTTHRRRNLH